MYHNNTLIHIDLRAEALRARRYLHPAVDETRPRGGCRSASGSDSHKVETDAGPTVRAWFMCVSSEETPADQPDKRGLTVGSGRDYRGRAREPADVGGWAGMALRRSRRSDLHPAHVS